MTSKSKFMTAATVLAMGFATGSAMAADPHANEKAEGKGKAHENQDKCYGIAKAGKNDCGAKDGSHACAGHAAEDDNANDWVYVPHGKCEEMGGQTG